MRYRPFTSEGLSSSAVGLSLTPGPGGAEVFRLVCTALESGVNTFSFAAGDAPALEALRRGVASVGRRVVILMLRLEIGTAPFEQQVRSALQATGAGHFDAVVLDRPAPDAVSREGLSQLEAIRSRRLATRLGLATEGDASQAYLSAFDFDLLALRYNVTSGWAERNMLKAAAQRGLTVIGYGPHIDLAPQAAPPIVRGLARLVSRGVAKDQAQAYGFLSETPEWTAEQITLAYALTEPGLASILVEAKDPKALEAVASVVERELPAGVAAQIEMARFASGAGRSVA